MKQYIQILSSLDIFKRNNNTYDRVNEATKKLNYQMYIFIK